MIQLLPVGVQRLCRGEVANEAVLRLCDASLSRTYAQPEGGVIPATWDRPAGPAVVPLWESEITLTAWRRGIPDFVEIDVEDPESPVVIGESPQGLLAYLFYFLIEDFGGARELQRPENSASYEELQAVSEVVGFQYLQTVLGFQSSTASSRDWHVRLLHFTQSFAS